MQNSVKYKYVYANINTILDDRNGFDLFVIIHNLEFKLIS